MRLNVRLNIVVVRWQKSLYMDTAEEIKLPVLFVTTRAKCANGTPANVQKNAFKR